MARLFGAGAGSDAFLVAWTVPETAAPLLVDGAQPLALIPAFSAALAVEPVRGPQIPHPARGPRPRTLVSSRDPVFALVRATLPHLTLLLMAATAALELGAPALVAAMAPGLTDPSLAVSCIRLTSIALLGFGLAGYFAAGLRAHQRFTAAAALYTVYNIAIVAVTIVAHDIWGIRAVAAGVSVGSLLVIGTTGLAFHRHCCPLLRGRRSRRARLGATGADLGVRTLLPVMVFSLGRQGQVYIERFFGSRLPAGTISHLNYAEKIAQTPMAVAVMISSVTVPVLTRALAQGDTARARDRVEQDLTLASAMTLLAMAFLIACAPQVVTLLFQRGSFSSADTAATSTVLRVYSLGLLGQVLVGAAARPHFALRASGGRARSAARQGAWTPARAAGIGLVVTLGVSALTAPRFGAEGLAAANVVGVTLTAVLLLTGLPPRGLPIRITRIGAQLGRLCAATLCSAAAAYAAARAAGPEPMTALLLGGTAAVAGFAVASLPTGLRDCLRHRERHDRDACEPPAPTPYRS
ncbi:murein biosynthesis integral membrane protein MurJ [Streptacidiphilus pinicola]|uniref:murein biosynthesis integral membrane protein MurJ n=1 Tax=Streptacidiphilus pinicola TaxID=2219663 RepID=UPI001401E36E|nr:lipid II flippase MurJ [Streptacidiphilus pinicola]